MKISTEKPPIYDEAEAAFGVGGSLWDTGTVFTYGDTVHCKKGSLTPDLITHEQIHIDRQAAYLGGAAAWWKRFLTDKDFRLEEETAAYKAQAAYIRTFTLNRTKRQQAINWIHQSMAMMYGDMISFADAQKLI